MSTTYGDGYGYGDGDGYGGGCGCYGYGSGDGKQLGVVGNYAVVVLSPWNYVRVGCRCGSIAWWRRHWENVARDNSVSVTQSFVEDMLCKASSCAAEPTVGA